VNWFVDGLKHYATFSGRACRRAYWHFFGMVLLVSIILSVFDTLIGKFDPSTGVGLFSGLFTLATLVPSLAVGARRLHDTNRSGWWLLIGLVPLVGIIVLIVFLVTAGDAGDNRFGPPPPLTA
jgi:uncharacterized membrane protein YhaH (DUF805 family)